MADRADYSEHNEARSRAIINAEQSISSKRCASPRHTALVIIAGERKRKKTAGRLASKHNATL
jgi:hypothetical protein